MRASQSALTLANVAFVGNVARLGGAFAQGGGGASVLMNVTFTANEAPKEGGGVRASSGSKVLLRNVVLWDNDNEIVIRSGSADLCHVLTEGGCPLEDAVCENLLDVDPLFLRDPDPGPDETWGTPDDDYGDLRLQDGSPALDFGLSEFLPPDTFDLDGDGDTAEPLPLDLAGEARVVGPEVDLGAYERQPPVAAEAPPSALALTLEVYPNLTRGSATLALALGQAQPVAVALFDVLGRRVAVLHDGPLAAGPHTLRLETAALPSGVYFVRAMMTAEAGGAVQALSQKLTVLR